MVQAMIEKIGIGFMLAPAFHPAMKRVGGLRKELGIRTVFNILGPLTNPAGAKAQVMGVYDPNLCEKLAQVLRTLGAERAMVVHGEGMDEITNTGETCIAELRDGIVKSYKLRPEDLGYPLARASDIAGGTPEENAGKLVQVMQGKESPARDIIAMNSGAAVYVSGLASTLKKGAEMAEAAIDSGKALETLQRMVNTNGEPQMLEAIFVTRIKICGLQDQSDLDAALKAGADAVGFVVEVERSRHCITSVVARDLIRNVPVFVKSVAVISPHDIDEAVRLSRETNADLLQVHSTLSAGDIRDLERACASEDHSRIARRAGGSSRNGGRGRRRSA